MNYSESVSYIENAAVFGAQKHGLENISILLERLGNPQRRFESVHVAGTNGKGSVCSYLDSVFRAHGFKVGLFTSPYLERFTERIRIDGTEIGEETFAEICTRVRKTAEKMVQDGLTHPTFFELVTACGFLAFAESEVDIAVIEVGLGGRLDATNVIQPVVSVITAIGLDHTKVLGETVEEIAGEKAGIIKAGVPVVIYPQPFDTAYAILLHRARELESPVYSVRSCSLLLLNMGLEGQSFQMSYQGTDLGSFHTGLLGPHQIKNAATAILASLVYFKESGRSLVPSKLRDGICDAKWPGRMEIVSQDPLTLLDGAHNPQGVGMLAEVLNTFIPNHDGVMLFAASRTKDIDQIARILAPTSAHFIITEAPIFKALDAEEAADAFRIRDVRPSVQKDMVKALAMAQSLSSSLHVPLVVSGSLYLVGGIRKLIHESG